MRINLQEAVNAWDVFQKYVDEEPKVFPDTEERVKHYYKIAARKTHPDHGGTQADFVAVDRAKHVLLIWTEQKQKAAPPEPGTLYDKCGNCDGTGRRRIRRGFNSMTMVCGTCHGTGDAQFEADKSDTGR